LNPILTSVTGSFLALESTNGGFKLTDTYAAGSGSLAGTMLDLIQTWNTSGSPIGIRYQLTNTASGGSSQLMSLEVGGTPRFSINVNGAVYLQASTSASFGWSGRSRIWSSADGILTISDNAQSSFSRLTFGGTSSSFPAIKRNTVSLEVRLADDSDFAGLQSLYLRFGSGSPEGVVTAPTGAVYLRTDGGAGSTMYVKESGSGNTGWVAK
jgi:hypothetical protein